MLQVLGFFGGLVEVSVILGCGAMSLGDLCQMFCDNSDMAPHLGRMETSTVDASGEQLLSLCCKLLMSGDT